MSFLDKLERALGRFALPNVSLYLVIGQVFVLLMAMLGRLDLQLFTFVPEDALRGDTRETAPRAPRRPANK